MEKNITLSDIGYDVFFDSVWEEYRDMGKYSLARVTSEHKKAYTIRDTEREYFATVTGKRMFKAYSREAYPVVGDFVVFTKESEDKATIHHILPRKTVLKRKYNNKEDVQFIATNVDYVFIVEALGRDYNLNRFERYVVLAKEGGVEPAILINKTDLIDKDALEEYERDIRNRFGNIEVISTSTMTGEGLAELSDFITKGNTYCFLGSSGVGKSSLINTLLDDTHVLDVQETSERSKRGKHTTTKREMYILAGGGIVIDNPGTREVGVAEVSDGIDEVFEDITALSHDCKYADCSHIHEPGCAVLKALEMKEIDKEKYKNFLRLKKENYFNEMRDHERRGKDKKFGKLIKKVKEDKKNSK